MAVAIAFREWMILLQITATLLLLLVPIVFTWWKFGWLGTTQDPLCGKCRYIVRGLSGDTCPECGSDLRQVGILPPGKRLFWKPLLICMTWSVVLPVVALGVSSLLVAYVLPCRHTQQMFRPVTIFMRAMPGNMSLTMAGHAIFWGGRNRPAVPTPAIPMQELTLSVQGSPGAPQVISLHVDWRTKAWRISPAGRPAIGRPGRFDDKAILAWLGRAGANTTDRDVQQLARDLLSAIDEIPQVQAQIVPPPRPAPTSPVPYGTIRNFGPTSGTAMPAMQVSAVYVVNTSQEIRWLIPVIGAFWLAVWLLGLRQIARGFRAQAAA